MLEERVLNEEIKIFKVGNVYRIYGKTFEVKDELSDIGAKWNKDKQKLELSEENFDKLSDAIKVKVHQLQEKQRQMSLENIAHIIISGQVQVYLNKDEEYQIYGKTREIYKDLQNIGFSLNEKSYTMRKEEFDRLFPNEVKEFINEYANKKEEQEETIVEEEIEEEEELEQ